MLDLSTVKGLGAHAGPYSEELFKVLSRLLGRLESLEPGRTRVVESPSGDHPPLIVWVAESWQDLGSLVLCLGHMAIVEGKEEVAPFAVVSVFLQKFVEQHAAGPLQFPVAAALHFSDPRQSLSLTVEAESETRFLESCEELNARVSDWLVELEPAATVGVQVH